MSLKSIAAPVVEYHLSMPEPHTHYFKVEMKVSGWKKNKATIKTAVWTPGSYLLREYAKNIEQFGAKDASGKKMQSQKIRKNAWELDTKNQEAFSVSYLIYANELAVRNAFLDGDMAYLNGAAIFPWTEGLENEPTTLKIYLPANWKKISTSLDQIENGLYKVKNLDELFDSPIQMGNHEVLEFQASGIPHQIAMVGDVVYNKERLLKDYATICTTAEKVFGTHPCKKYLFIVHHMAGSGSGGLEHLNSSSLQAGKSTYFVESQYQNFLSLVAHEYFHLWNVKRLRPIELGPFDYEKENYTRLLWFSEGFTSYYDDFINFRSGLMDKDRFLDVTASNIMASENTPGTYIQSLAESSFDAWIKYYRPNENSANATSSYYTRGSVIGLLLDLEILNLTQGSKNLDDLMRMLYKEYYEKKNQGFTMPNLMDACKKLTGKSMDVFFNNHIEKMIKPDYNAIFAPFGYKLVNKNEGSNKAWLGIGTKVDNNRLLVTSKTRKSPAWKAGINLNDEIIAIDSQRVNGEINTLLSNKKPGDEIQVTLYRAIAGKVETVKVVLERDPVINYKLESFPNLSKEQERLRNAWLRK